MTADGPDRGPESAQKPPLPAPVGLRAPGKRLWSDVTAAYTLRADERRVLEDCCRLADVVGRLERAMRGQPLLVEGSAGQLVLNPLLIEQRTHRLALSTLLRQLKLPEDPSAGARPNQAGPQRSRGGPTRTEGMPRGRRIASNGACRDRTVNCFCLPRTN
jgi:hypothetical protein